jgi:hypothetical protein
MQETCAPSHEIVLVSARFVHALRDQTQSNPVQLFGYSILLKRNGVTVKNIILALESALQS